MSKFCSIVKNELARYFLSPLAYVYLLAFLSLNASFTLYLGDFLGHGEARLDLMFSFLPWIYLIFISGIAMRLWSDEFKSKTITQIISLPVSLSMLVWGKFVAAWLFCAFGLALTFPFIITVNVLGTPDNYLIGAGYLACLLLSAAMLAVAQTVSSMTKNQIIALILSVIFNLLFFLSGIEYVLGVLRHFLPYQIVESLAGLSFLSHFGDISSGLIGLKDILFFVSVVIAFNFLTVVIIQFKTFGVISFVRSNAKYVFVFLISAGWLGFIGFNMMSNRLLENTALDVTQEKNFTLSESAQKILQQIREPITVKIYYSPVLSQRNPLFRNAVSHLRLLMKQYQSFAPEKLHYRFYYPQFLNEAEDMAVHDQMVAIPLPDINQNAYFGATILDEAGNTKHIPFIPLENLDKIGQEFLQNIYELSARKPTVGILSSLPVFGIRMDENRIGNRWQIIDEIEKLYQIKQINEPNNLEDIDVLLLIHPQNLSDEMTKALAKYTLSGGKILILADIGAEAQRLYSPLNQRLTPSDFNGLNILWGFEFNSSAVVADLKNSITVNTGNAQHPNYTQDIIQFTIGDKQINRTLPETAYLSQLLFASATPVTSLPHHKSVFIPLLTTSANSALLPSSVIYENINPAALLAQFKSDDTPKTIAAKIISSDKAHPFEVIVIGDSDFAYDDFWSRFKMFEEHKYSIVLNDNANFLLNALDTLCGRKDLIELRQSKTLSPRFEAWENLRKQNALNVAVRERELFDEINQIKEKLNNLWQQKNFEERQDFSDDELSVLSDFRKSLQGLKQELSNLKLNQDANLQQKKNAVIFWNLYAIPLIILIGLLITLYIGRAKPKHSLSVPFRLSKKLIALSVLCGALFGGGLLTVYSIEDTGNAYEDTPVFPDWEDKLNNVAGIELKHQGQTLSFYKQDGFWMIKGFENYPLYQRRIINFLATLSDARYLERKSARAEYLAKFGLDPAHATQIVLKDDKGQSLLEIEVGNYDEEIGRGGRGAFIKFSNRFQVWLIEADFISLSTDWRDWTLNTALNLRFGRLKTSSLTNDQDILVLLMKELLNTPLTEVNVDKNALKTLSQIHLIFENDDDMTIYFAQDEQNKSYISYQFGKTDTAYLRLFATYAKDKYYEIPTENMEKIKDVFSALGQTNH